MSDGRMTAIDCIGDIELGSHMCQFYGTRQELAETLVPYFAAGLQEGEFCIWVTGAPLTVEESKTELQRMVPSLDRHLESGQIQIWDYRDWYLKGGSFDGKRVLEQWAELHAQALDRGFRGVRGSGDCSWLDKSDWSDFVAYEAEVNRGSSALRMLALCTYSADCCEGDAALQVAHNHQSTVVRIDEQWEKVESFRETSSAQVQRLVSRLLQLQDEERRRIAAQLFDVTAQDLFAISLSLSGLQPMVETPSVKSALAKCRELCEQNIQGIRSLSDVLHPPLLDRFGLAFALESYIEGFVKRNGIAVELQVASGLGRFPLSTETNLFRIVEEGLSNIVRHSGNTAATVRAERQENFVILRIEDFGQGLPAAAMVAISSGAGDLGLVVLGMRERMRQIGGSLEIRSTNRGTVLTASVPLD